MTQKRHLSFDTKHKWRTAFAMRHYLIEEYPYIF